MIPQRIVEDALIYKREISNFWLLIVLCVVLKSNYFGQFPNRVFTTKEIKNCLFFFFNLTNKSITEMYVAWVIMRYK